MMSARVPLNPLMRDEAMDILRRQTAASSVKRRFSFIAKSYCIVTLFNALSFSVRMASAFDSSSMADDSRTSCSAKFA